MTHSSRSGSVAAAEAFAFVQVLPGFTAAAYERVLAALGPAPPDGLVAHLAGPCPDGWRIIEVWRSAGQHARFERERLWPALTAAGALAAVSAAPLVERLDLSHILLGPAGPADRTDQPADTKSMH